MPAPTSDSVSKLKWVVSHKLQCREGKESRRKMEREKTFEIVTCAHYFLFSLISRRDKVKQKALNKQPSHTHTHYPAMHIAHRRRMFAICQWGYTNTHTETQSESMVHDANVWIIMDSVVRLSFVCYLIRHCVCALHFSWVAIPPPKGKRATQRHP